MKKILVTLLMLITSSSALASTLEFIYQNQAIHYDSDQLLQIETKELKTLTPWSSGVPTFKGFTLKSLLDKHQIHSGKLKMVALNDYSIEVEVTALLYKDAFIAMYQDSKKLRVRDKGPYWLIFPWSQREELINSDISNWSIWQIKTIEHIQ